MLALPWRVNLDAEYEAACLRCEIRIPLTEDSRALILAPGVLTFDKRKDGSHGRALSAPIPSLGLRSGDRLEPSPELPDVAMLETLQLPSTVVLWRLANDTSRRHRCPLWDDAIGLSPHRTIALDLLHSL